MNRTRLTVLAAIAALAGCSSGGDQPSGSTFSSTGTATTSSSATASSTTASGDATIAEHCWDGAPGTIEGLSPDAQTNIRVGKIGSGTTAVVMLHQHPGTMCGWVPYAEWASTKGKLMALPIDMCGYGQTRCSAALTDDPAKAVAAVVDHARKTLGAKRVVVAGASMGGAVALASAQSAGADAVIDLSGPAVWQRVPDAETAAKQTTIPLLLVVAPQDAEMQPDVLRRAVKSSPAKDKRFVEAPDGHGWSMLSDGAIEDPTITPIGKTVLDWIQGKYGS